MPSTLDVCELAWADKTGYVILSTRDPRLTKQDEKYWVDHSFRWPQDKDKILSFIARARSGPLDLYWAPAVFNKPKRRAGAAKSTDMLWADLDEVDPTELPKHLKPTAAWQSSPGRYQALWQMDHKVKPEVQSNINQRLTYTIGADKGGWDLPQVLRLPGTANHKYPTAPQVKLEWLNGHQVRTSQLLKDLPELEVNGGLHADAGEQGTLPDPRSVLRDHRIPSRAKAILRSRHADVGTRSDRLWQVECLLAEAGLTAEEIASVVRPSVWNKYRGRRDEIKRLLTEARKAIDYAGVGEEQPAVIQTNGHIEPEPDTDEVEPLSWSAFDRDRKAVRWLVGQVWGEGEVGFISGLPKSYKSWISLDLAVGVATGGHFLNMFQCEKRNVLLIQEEDPRPVLQSRLSQVAANHGLVECEVLGPSTARLRYSLPDNLYVLSNSGFVVNEEWLESLQGWIEKYEIGLTILDPLSMIAGEVDEFKMFELMAGLLKPLKQIREQTDTAICIVHHHTKDGTKTGAAGMYGSVAFWAWEEAALHLSTEGLTRVRAERFSKHDMLMPITIELGEVNERWNPQVVENSTVTDFESLIQSSEMGITIEELMSVSGMGRDAVVRHLRRFEDTGQVIKVPGSRSGKGGRPAHMWRWVRVQNQAVEEE